MKKRKKVWKWRYKRFTTTILQHEHTGIYDNHKLQVDESSAYSEPLNEFTPEQNMWLYCVLDAIKRWQQGSKSDYWWLFESSAFRPGSFHWIGEYCDLDVEYLRIKLWENRENIDLARIQLANYARGSKYERRN